MRLLNSLSQFLTDAKSIDSDSILESALDTVRRHLDMPIAYLSEFVGDNVVFRKVSSCAEVNIIEQGSARPAEGSYCLAVLEGTLPKLIPDTSMSRTAMEMPVTHRAPVGAIASVPVRRADGSVYGMFCCLSPTAKPDLNERDLEVVTMFATLAANLVNAKLEEETGFHRLQRKIHGVIHNLDFKIHFQPIVAFKTDRSTSWEALSRFQPSPYASPDKWFREASSVGLARDLELVTLRKALSLLTGLPKNASISLNVSFDMAMDDMLIDLIRNFSGDRIILELTEHEKFNCVPETQKKLRQLRAMGVKIAIDDFGAGYSGLSTMLQLKPDILKMDRSLVMNIDSDASSQALTKALVFFSNQIDAELVAEGIETENELKCLQELGVENGQGYLFGKPQSLDTVAA